MPEKRRILFLQGPPGLFWRELAIAFEAAGHATFKIHLQLGDFLYWFRSGGSHYRGRFAGWEAFLDRYVVANGITDILYYSDRQPYHVVAQEVAARHGINAIAVENGYLRPDWITIEHNGMGAFSFFPDDSGLIRRLAQGLPAQDLEVRYRHGIVTEMTHEITYNLCARVYRLFYPLYKSGCYYSPFTEYVRGLLYHTVSHRRDRLARAVVDELAGGSRPYYVVALQLQSDKQIQANSPFTHLSQMIEQVVGSFAAHAPKDAILLFKEHPHDNGVENWRRATAGSAAHHGLGERVRYICGGDLGKLLQRASGCVVVNSTVGLHALRAGVPTKVLGVAIYDLAGLTDQKPLDQFWRDPAAIDADLLDAFTRLMAATIQIKGSFYNPAGRRAAIAEVVRRIAEDRVNGDANMGRAPRLGLARRIGVPIPSTVVGPPCD